jgi:hypothetical protein
MRPAFWELKASMPLQEALLKDVSFSGRSSQCATTFWNIQTGSDQLNIHHRSSSISATMPLDKREVDIVARTIAVDHQVSTNIRI